MFKKEFVAVYRPTDRNVVNHIEKLILADDLADAVDIARTKVDVGMKLSAVHRLNFA